MPEKSKADLMSRVRSFRGKGKKPGRNTHFIGIRLPPDVKREIEAQAKRDGVSLNSYMQDLVAAKANGASTPDAIEEERGRSAEREIRRELLNSVASAGDIRRSLAGLRDLNRGLLADAERALREGRYSFWRGEADQETKKIIAALELAIADLKKHVAEARTAILAARPKKPETQWDRIVGAKQ